jgi:hypothetical protein
MPAAFVPLIGDRIQYGAKVNGLLWNEDNKTLPVAWRPTGSEPYSIPNNIETFDYVLNSVPLNLMKF